MLVTAGIMIGLPQVLYAAKQPAGWEKTEQGYIYLDPETGQKKEGWLLDQGVWYYLDPETGLMFHDGWKYLDGHWYWFKYWGGAARNQWVKVDGYWYYFNQWCGMKESAWIKQGDAWYWVNRWGAMVSGNQKINGVYYPFDSNGAGRFEELIALDAGHQRKGNNEKEPIGPGASAMKAKVSSGTMGVATGKNEYELNLEVSLKLRDELLKRGYPVYMIRETHDVDISNSERALMAAAMKADVLIRIHANGSENRGMDGALTMAPSVRNPFVSSIAKDSQLLSQKIIDAFCQTTGARNRGVYQTDDMSGINWSKIPVTIVEMGYMTNPQEDRKMTDASYQDKMVRGIADGIDAYYR